MYPHYTFFNSMFTSMFVLDVNVTKIPEKIQMRNVYICVYAS